MPKKAQSKATHKMMTIWNSRAEFGFHRLLDSFAFFQRRYDMFGALNGWLGSFFSGVSIIFVAEIPNSEIIFIASTRNGYAY